MKFLKRLGVYALCGAFVLSGCVTNSGGSSNGSFRVGPKLASLLDPTGPAQVDASKPKLDIVIPIFDPGLSSDTENYEEQNVWPELRRAEANRFAYKLKAAMEETGAFGAVRVAPDSTATADLYVLGKVLVSNGEEVEIEIEVIDIAGQHWFTRTFDHTVEAGFHKNPRNDGKDPYEPVFDEAANRIALELDDYEIAELHTLKQVTELRFGANFSEEAFVDHLAMDDGEITLASFPSDGDPMLKRTRAIRVREQMFVDGMQDTYRAFSQDMDPSYLVWQEQSLTEIEAQREADTAAAGQAALGVLGIGLGILAIAAGANSDNTSNSTALLAGGVAAGAVGINMMQKSFQTSEEAKVHRDALAELGESIDLEMSPQVIAFEEKTVELTGTAKEQFAQWRAFLQKIYEQERTPDVQL